MPRWRVLRRHTGRSDGALELLRPVLGAPWGATAEEAARAWALAAESASPVVVVVVCEDGATRTLKVEARVDYNVTDVGP